MWGQTHLIILAGVLIGSHIQGPWIALPSLLAGVEPPAENAAPLGQVNPYGKGRRMKSPPYRA